MTAATLVQAKVLDITPNSILLLEDRKTRLVPANTFNTLRYVIRGAFAGIQGESHTKVYLGGKLAISPTTQEYVFCLEYAGDLVHTIPEKDSELCRAVIEAHTNKDCAPLISLFKQLHEKKLKTELLDLILYAFGKRVKLAILSETPGYVVDERFLVSQNGNAYKIMPNGKLRHLCIVPKNHNIKETSLVYKGVRIKLGQQEQIFLSKIVALLDREKYKHDGTFWRQVADDSDA